MHTGHSEPVTLKARAANRTDAVTTPRRRLNACIHIAVQFLATGHASVAVLSFVRTKTPVGGEITRVSFATIHECTILPRIRTVTFVRDFVAAKAIATPHNGAIL